MMGMDERAQGEENQPQIKSQPQRLRNDEENEARKRKQNIDQKWRRGSIKYGSEVMTLLDLAFGVSW